MDALDDVAEVEEPKPKARRVPLGPLAMSMPKRPPCAGTDQGETFTIHVLIPKGESRKLYMRIDGLDWFLSYAADEFHFQNIVRQAEQPPPAAAEDHIEWEFNKRSWVATVDVGPNAGKQFFNPDGLQLHQWRKLQQLSLITGNLSRSSFLKRKKAAKEIAKLWCAATREGEGQTFEQEWLYAVPEKPALYEFEPDPERVNFAPVAAVAGGIDESELLGVGVEG